MYDLELDKAKDLIIAEKAKNVLIQLPDGLKPKAKEIREYLEEKTNSNIFFWAGSCFGACDYPSHAKDSGIDLLIAFGHSEWN